MSEKIIGYANYGVLAHEKQCLFTAERPIAEANDKVEITLPEGWKTCEDITGGMLIESPDKKTFPAGEILESKKDEPYLVWNDAKGWHSEKLDWKEI